MKTRTTLAVLSMVLVSVVALSGCKGDSKPPAGERVDTGYADVVLKLEPDPPMALKDTSLTAEIKDTSGRPLTGARVVFDLSMPGMYHGENRPVGGEFKPGVYKGDGVFTMGGKWLIKVEVKAPGVDVVKKYYTVVEGG
jgi:YtkA-like